MRELLTRLRDWFRRDALDRELQEELAFHQQQLERERVAGGATSDHARSAARRQLGNLTAVRESSRDRWSFASFDNFLQDVRLAVRGLRRSPVFTATAVITLALGIGANAAMLSVVDRMMYRPLSGLRRADDVHRVYWQSMANGKLNTSTSTQYTRYLDLKTNTRSFDVVAAFSERDVAVGEGESARELRVGVVSASYFDLFDAPPAVGRYFTASEDQTPRGADVAVISYAFWQSEYGGSDVVGKLLQVGNVRATIIGVAARNFNGVNDAVPPAVYVPVTTYAGSTGTNDSETYYTKYQWGWINVLARRKPDISIEAANTDATNAFRQSWQRAFDEDKGNGTVEGAQPRVLVSAVRTGGGPVPSLEARTAWWTGVVSSIVLLIACANVANLSLARALKRRRETAVKLALGVTKARLLSQTMTEGFVLASVAGVVALIVAHWSSLSLQQLLVSGAQRGTTPGVDARLMLAVAALSIVSGLIVGFLPSLITKGGDLASRLRGGVRGGTNEGGRLRSSLLVAQAALSVVLLVGATLFVRSLDAVQDMRMGYDVSRVLLINRVNRGAKVEEAPQRAMRDVLMQTAATLPGVESVAWLSSAPFVSTSSTSLFVQGIDSVSRLGVFTMQATTPDYFRTMGTRIVRGRELLATDRLGAPGVAVVSETMARTLWPGQDAIGKCFRMRADTMPCTQVVGVAEDMVQNGIAGGQRTHYYVPLEQYTRTWGNWMALRMTADPAVNAERVRVALQRVMPPGAYVNSVPLSRILRDEQRSWRLGAGTFGAFGLLALVVAAVGLYGVLGYNVAQRMHELSLRVALGAQRGDVLRLVIGQGMRLVLLGCAIGLGLALASSRWLQPLLFEQNAKDPATYLGVALLMSSVALLAGAVPALRASGADPNAALREE
jgi:putative ABC transport system permease protein